MSTSPTKVRRSRALRDGPRSRVCNPRVTAQACSAVRPIVSHLPAPAPSSTKSFSALTSELCPLIGGQARTGKRSGSTGWRTPSCRALLVGSGVGRRVVTSSRCRCTYTLPGLRRSPSLRSRCPPPGRLPRLDPVSGATEAAATSCPEGSTAGSEGLARGGRRLERPSVPEIVWVRTT